MVTVDYLDTILQLIDRIYETVARQTPAGFAAASDAVDAVTYRHGPRRQVSALTRYEYGPI